MEKTLVASIAIVAAVVIVLAAAVALIPYQSQAGTGNLAVMGTDPPMAADGVSDGRAHYSSVQAHKSGSDMNSGWTQVSGSGTMDLMATGTAQVLATSQVNAASYDAFKFNVDSVDVVYQGQSYTATVASSTIAAQSQSKVLVNASSTATAIVDLRTFIINAGTTSSPQFVFSASAVATAVPPRTTASVTLNLGSTLDLSTQAWWNGFVAQTSTNLQVTGSLSSNSLSLNLQNSGNANAEVQEIIITPVSTTAYVSSSLPSSLSSSTVFTVSNSGSLQQSSSLQGSALLSGGTTIVSRSSGALSYSGNVASTSTTIVTGQQYVVTCIGANTYASTTVVAS